MAVSEDDHAVHTGFMIAELDPGGWIPWHVHSYEESYYVATGTAVVDTAEGSFRLREGGYGVVPVGMPHRLRNDSELAVRWAEMQAPMPRSAYQDDTFLVSGPAYQEAADVDVRDPRNRYFGRITPSHMDATKQSQDLLEVTASMRTALLVYGGINVKMMVDSDLGAQLATMFMVHYDPDGATGPHDHPFEETYFFLEGRAEATFDGKPVVLGVRPDHVLRQDAPSGSSVRMMVKDVEPLGPHTLVIGTVGAFPFTAQMPVGVAAAPDRVIDVALDLERTHLFDKVSGKAIC